MSPSDLRGVDVGTRMKMSMSGSPLSQVSFATDPSTRTLALIFAVFAAEATLLSSPLARASISLLSCFVGVTLLRTLSQTLSIPAGMR
jgi:hypothetical protein